MGRLIDDLLGFSRLSRKRGDFVTIDMEAMARKVFEERVAMEPGRKIRLNLHPIPPALGMDAMIRQLWTNSDRECRQVYWEARVGRDRDRRDDGGSG